MFISKLREAIICFRAGRVTLPYPFAPHDPADGFRGKIEIDVERCIGCAGCANVCPSRAIVVTDPCTERRIIDYYTDRCTYCARCEEVCPQEAIKMSKAFETATDSIEDLRTRNEIFMGTCQRCGRCFEPPTALDKMMVTGMRAQETEVTGDAL